MTTIVVANRDIQKGADEVFNLFGTGTSSSWLLNARCESVRVGELVTVQLPMPKAGTGTVELLGRIVGHRRGRLIEVLCHQPWRGRLRVKLTPRGVAMTRVVISLDIDEAGLDWVAASQGWQRALPESGMHRVGLLTSKSGPASVFAIAGESLAELAVEEINAEGGLLGRAVELVVADDATSFTQAEASTRHLLRSGCNVIVGCCTSIGFRGMRRAAAGYTVPLIHTILNEGGRGAKHVLRWGERPLDQVRALTGAVTNSSGGRSWYLVGEDYSWGVGAHQAATRAIKEAGGTVDGVYRVPFGTADYSHVIEDIRRRRSSCVLSSLNGADDVAFQQQAFEAGLHSSTEMVSLMMDEATRERVGDAAASGIWTALGYFQALDTDLNQDLKSRYLAKFGPWAPPISTHSVSVYEAIMLYAAAVRSGKDHSPRDILSRLHCVTSNLPRGRVRSEGTSALQQDVLVAQAIPGGFRIDYR